MSSFVGPGKGKPPTLALRTSLTDCAVVGNPHWQGPTLLHSGRALHLGGGIGATAAAVHAVVCDSCGFTWGSWPHNKQRRPLVPPFRCSRLASSRRLPAPGGLFSVF